jgi:hypothetical protein
MSRPELHIDTGYEDGVEGEDDMYDDDMGSVRRPPCLPACLSSSLLPLLVGASSDMSPSV